MKPSINGIAGTGAVVGVDVPGGQGSRTGELRFPVADAAPIDRAFTEDDDPKFEYRGPVQMGARSRNEAFPIVIATIRNDGSGVTVVRFQSAGEIRAI
jgi:hypothetical protein